MRKSVHRGKRKHIDTGHGQTFKICNIVSRDVEN